MVCAESIFDLRSRNIVKIADGLQQMQGLRQTVLEVMDVQRNGSKLIQRDDNTLVLSNTTFVNHKMLDVICEQQPHVDISIVESTKSDGFLVIFALCTKQSLFLSAHFMQIFLCMILIASCCMFHAE